MKYLFALLFTVCGFCTVLAQKAQNSTDKTDMVYSVAQKMPVFPGGDQGFEKFISKNLRYPKKAMEKKIQGKVYVSMIIEKDGSVKKVKVERGTSSPELNAEAVRVVSSSPKWTPGQQNGKTVRVYSMVPIEFSLL